MSSGEKHLQQAAEWLAAPKAETSARIYIDMPEIGWIYPSKMSVDDGILTCEYTTAYRLPGTITCSVDIVTASQLTHVPDLSFLSRA